MKLHRKSLLGSVARNPCVLRGFGRGPGVAGWPGGGPGELLGPLLGPLGASRGPTETPKEDYRGGFGSSWETLATSGGLWGPVGL